MYLVGGENKAKIACLFIWFNLWLVGCLLEWVDVLFCFRLPFTFVTKEVADATCECLLAQAEQAEKMGKSKAAAERMILEEFGRCLMRVINSAGKSKSDPCAMNCWRVHMSHNEANWTEHLRHRDTLIWNRGFSNTCQFGACFNWLAED